MWAWLNSGDTWLVLASLGISVVALVAWISNAGDDWLAPDPALDAADSRVRATSRQDVRPGVGA